MIEEGCDYLQQNFEEKVVLVGCRLSNDVEERFLYSLQELEALTKTAGGTVIEVFTQARPRLDSATYIGKGKLAEIVEFIEENEVDIVIFNDELSTSQVRNLTEALSARVIDRTQLILDIFSQRAKSREGKLQVELAQLNYLLPRLAGQGHALSRLGGGIGTRGPGETQLETDRRHIRRRMDEIKQQLETIVKHRALYRERRKETRSFQIALVGYTNAGKSTILNRLTEAESLEEDKLFATLDPLTRRLKLPSGYQVLLTDTVGFIQDLPTTLVAAFRSTLEEVGEADLLLNVVDASNRDYYNHEQTVLELLETLDVNDIPILTVYNKRDQMADNFVPTEGKTSVLMSALRKGDRERLLLKIEEAIKSVFTYYEVSIPANEGRLLSLLKTNTIVLAQEWLEEQESYSVKGYADRNSSFYYKINQFQQ